MKKRLLSLVMSLAMICGFAAFMPELDLKASAAGSHGYVWPVPDSSSITSGRGFSSYHFGIDINSGGKSDCSIIATKSGTIKYCYRGCKNRSGLVNGSCQSRGMCSPSSGKYYNGMCNSGCGNGIIIQHDDGTWSEYSHMKDGSIPSSFTVGTYVKQGQYIGTMGDSGNASGVHLHFSICSESWVSNYWSIYSTKCIDPLSVVSFSDIMPSWGDMQNLGDDFYAKIIINDNWLPIVDVDSRILLQEEKNNANEMWFFDRQTDGSYTIKNVGSGLYLEVCNIEDKDGAIVQTYTYNGSTAQKWYIRGRWSGEFTLSPSYTSRVLDVYGGNNQIGDKLNLWSDNGSKAQKFAIYKFDPVSPSKLTVNTGTCRKAKFSWTKTDNTTYYAVRVWKNEKWVGDPCIDYHTDKLSYTAELPPGEYEGYIDSANYYSYKPSNFVKFTVLDHNYTASVIVPSCTAQGYTLHICSRCDDSYKDDFKKTTNHNWGTPTYTWSADGKSCTAKRICKNDSSHVETEKATITSKVKTAATCTAKGTTTYTATFKNTAFKTQTKDVQDIAAKGHSWETPTYTWSADGKGCTAKRVCKNDSSHIETEKATINSKVKMAATCTAKGTTTYTATFKNTAFKTQTKDVQDLAVTNHNWFAWNTTKAATCTADGSQTRTCSVCKKVETQSIAKLGHNYETTVVKPTCTVKGYTLHKCSRCGDSYKDIYTAAKGHTWSDWTTTKKATCTAEGSQERTCSVCGKTETGTIAKLGHSYKTTVVKPTCTAKGYMLHKCSRCGDNYKDTYKAATGHSWSDWTTAKKATCTAEGSQERTCSVCGKTETDTIAKLGHNYKTTIVKPTCTAKGYTLHKCSRCGDNYKDTYKAATGHTWSDWTTTKKATCTAEGSQERTCSVCGKTETDTIAKLGHNYKTTIVKPTCTAKGYTLHKCSRCEDNYKDTYKAATGHTWSDWTTTKKATCTAEGSKTRTCSVCKKTETADIAINTNAHSWNAPTYAWSSNGKICTATRVCANNSTHKETEKVSTTGKQKIPPTCTVKGITTYTATFKNTAFKTLTKDVQDIAATGHKITATAAKSATCTTDGNKAYWYCSNCKKYFSDAAGKTETTLSATVIKAKGHSWTNWKTTGFDVAKGTSTQTRTCSVCKKTETKTEKSITRLSGSTRYATSVEISKASYTKAKSVILASGTGYADALAGVPLAKALNAPILLTEKAKLPSKVLSEIKRLGATDVIILGGEGAIGKEVVTELKKNKLKVERIAGKTRFSTATAIAERLNPDPREVIFVYGMNYADALSVSTAAALKKAPIIYLTTDGELNADTSVYLTKIKNKVKNTYVIGGKGVVSDDMMSKAAKALGLSKSTRIAGNDRYSTCVAVNNAFKSVLTGKMICVATGTNFPDALAGGVFAAKNNAPLFLINGLAKTPNLNDDQKEYLKAKKPDSIAIFGGTGAVPDSHIADIAKNSL